MLRRENSELFSPSPQTDDDDSAEEGDDLAEVFIAYETEMRRKAERFIFRTAGKSRFLVMALGSIASMVVGPFDSSTSLHMENVATTLQCPANWDGAFNVRIAVHGYEYEESHAFFPLFPFVARTLSKVSISQKLGLQNNDNLSVAMAGALFNNILFVCTSIVLFRLGCAVLKDERLAMRAALLFCFNPASIFFSVAYNESIFAFFSFLGMLMLFRQPGFRGRLLATICFAFATLSRANGALLGLFSLWAAYRDLMRDESRHRYARAIFQLAVVGSIHLAALVSVLGYGWYKYCFVADESRRPWCDNLLPNIYGFVQDKYWNVGFLRYYEAKQIPNFILAAPALIIAWEALIRYRWVLPLPFLVQMLLSLLVGALVMHVQVFTRFVCASTPMFYWYAAELTLQKSAVSYFVYVYFAFYFMLGTSMFCAYFPWT